jgi:beta-xylosidase
VESGSQAVLRSRNIRGPYEHRTVLSKGTTEVQGPHQGAYVETPSGEGWFVHFNSTGAYGRIVYLEPVKWEDDWPIVGERLAGTAIGQPVQSHAAPDVGRTFPAVYPQTSDEFSARTLGPQWEWNHNPLDSHWSLTERPGFLRLKALSAPNLVSARNTLTQMLQARAIQITARLSVDAMAEGQRAGLAMFGRRPSWIGVVRNRGERRVTFAEGGVETPGPSLGGGAGRGSGGEVGGEAAQRAPGFVLLRMQVDDEQARYSYSLDAGKTFTALGSRTRMLFSWWKAARPALFTYNTNTSAADAGIADFDWMRVEPLRGVARQ